MASTPKDTSWGHVADWYDEHLSEEGTYHETVIAPNLVRLLELKPSDTVLDIASGNGYFTRLLAPQARQVMGIDTGEALVAKARERAPSNTTFEVGSAESLDGIDDESFSKALCVLAMQNIRSVPSAAQSAARVLKAGGLMCVVLNHPAFRIPGTSSWQFDEEANIQFRRLDSYMTETETQIDMAPGTRKLGEKNFTLSFHRPLQFYIKAFTNAGFCLTRFEEWVSPKTSQDGPRKKAEDRARKEFPLFLALVFKKN